MNLAKISANGQITCPVEIRRLLGLKSEDKIMYNSCTILQSEGAEE